MSEVRSYNKYEFCIDINCHALVNSGMYFDVFTCSIKPKECRRTAKEFHKWLSKNGFMILKEAK